jgi:hypothetical protein
VPRINKVARELGVGTGTVQRIKQEMTGPFADAAAWGRERTSEAKASKAMIILMTLLIAGASMAFAVHQ